jgi:CheY-like chemotaxis protein
VACNGNTESSWIGQKNKTQARVAYPIVRRFRDKPGVLVVDDEHLVWITVQLGLERNGFDVWLASNGWEAIDLYREHREDIAAVLLDLRLPGLDGPQTLDALRQLNPEVLACFISDDPGAYQPDELRHHGAASIIAKPFFLGDLANTLRLLTNGVPADLLPSGGDRPEGEPRNNAHHEAEALDANDPCGRR